MLHRLYRSQIGKHRLQIVVGKTAELLDRHKRVKFPRLHIPSSESLDEERLIVVGDSRTVGRNVRANGGSVPCSAEDLPSGKLHSGYGLMMVIDRRMAI